MKTLEEFILEKESKEQVYVVYYENGEMENYYTDEEEAKSKVEELNKECEDNKASYKKEPKSNFEK